MDPKIQQILAAVLMVLGLPACTFAAHQAGFWMFAAGFVWLVLVRGAEWLGEDDDAKTPPAP